MRIEAARRKEARSAAREQYADPDHHDAAHVGGVAGMLGLQGVRLQQTELADRAVLTA